MKSERFEMRMSVEFLAAIDQRRGQMSRAAWITRALIGELARTKNEHADPGPSLPVVENLRETAKGTIEVADPSKPARYVQTHRVRSDPGEGTPLPKIAPRKKR